jgi:hypothetical protein
LATSEQISEDQYAKTGTHTHSNKGSWKGLDPLRTGNLGHGRHPYYTRENQALIQSAGKGIVSNLSTGESDAPDRFIVVDTEKSPIARDTGGAYDNEDATPSNYFKQVYNLLDYNHLITGLQSQQNFAEIEEGALKRQKMEESKHDGTTSASCSSVSVAHTVSNCASASISEPACQSSGISRTDASGGTQDIHRQHHRSHTTVGRPSIPAMSAVVNTTGKGLDQSRTGSLDQRRHTYCTGDSEVRGQSKPSQKTPAVSLAKPNMVLGAEMGKMGRNDTEPQTTRGKGDQHAALQRNPGEFPDSKTDDKQQITGMKRKAEIARHIEDPSNTGGWKGLDLSRVIPVDSDIDTHTQDGGVY